MSLDNAHASTADIFQVCRRTYSEPLSRVAAECLYWCQFPRYALRGRHGIYKTSEELAKAIGKSPSAVSRALMQVCSLKGKASDPNAILFDLDYGPLPWAHAGRVRWLFVSPTGQDVIREARARKADRSKNAGTKKSKLARSVDQKGLDQSQQIAATLLSQPYASLPTTENLSTTPEAKESPPKVQEKLQEEVKRLVNSWNKVCAKSNKADLSWGPKQVARQVDDLAETVAGLKLNSMSDSDLEGRLTRLCDDLKSLTKTFSPSFDDYNKDGLQLESFIRYGRKLMQLAEGMKPYEFKFASVLGDCSD